MNMNTQCYNLNKSLDDCQIQRIKQLSKELRSSKEYKKLAFREGMLYNQLRAGISDEMKYVLCKYTDMFNELFTLYENFYYRQGFLECGQFLASLCKGCTLYPCPCHLYEPCSMLLNACELKAIS